MSMTWDAKTKAVANFCHMVDILLANKTRIDLEIYFKNLKDYEQQNLLDYYNFSNKDQLFRHIRNHVENYLAK